MAVCFYVYFKLLSEFADGGITLPPNNDYLYSFRFMFSTELLKVTLFKRPRGVN